MKLATVGMADAGGTHIHSVQVSLWVTSEKYVGPLMTHLLDALSDADRVLFGFKTPFAAVHAVFVLMWKARPM